MAHLKSLPAPKWVQDKRNGLTTNLKLEKIIGFLDIFKILAGTCSLAAEYLLNLEEHEWPSAISKYPFLMEINRRLANVLYSCFNQKCSAVIVFIKCLPSTMKTSGRAIMANLRASGAIDNTHKFSRLRLD